MSLANVWILLQAASFAQETSPPETALQDQESGPQVERSDADGDRARAGPPNNFKINEIRIDEPSVGGGDKFADKNEYFELHGPPGASLDNYWYLVIGDGPTTIVNGQTRGRSGDGRVTPARDRRSGGGQGLSQ
jgi:hypothetical protein